MLRIKFNSPLLALIATCGLVVSSAAFAANPLALHPANPPAPGGGHGGGPGGGSGGGGGGGGGGFGGGGHSAPAPAPASGHDGFPGAGGVHGTPHNSPGNSGGNPGGNPGGNHDGNPGGGFHPAPAPAPVHPAPAPAPIPAPVHPAPAPAPAPFPGGNHGGGNPGFPGGNHDGNPGGGYHPAPAPAPIPVPVHPAPAPAPFPGGNHGGDHDGFPGPGGVHGTPHDGPGFPGGGYHPAPAPAPIPVPVHPAPAPFPGGNHGGDHDGFPGPGGVHGTPHDMPHGFPVGHTHGPGYSYGHDGHGNIVSPIYHDHLDFGRRRMDDMRRDSRIRVIVDRRTQDWRMRDRDDWMRYNDRFVRYHDIYRDHYRPWWKEGFYGGCYWEFHPYYDIDTYFYDPMVYWFYADADDYYYRTWYGTDYDRYPVFKTRYRYTGVFFPTEEFRDLNLGVSAMNIEAQANYLNASTFLGESLNSEIRSRGGSSLSEKSVVINHYQVLPDDVGIVIEGYVNQGDIQFSFKAVLDLRDPDNSSVFAVSSEEEMSDQRLDDLRQLNTQIEDMGGVAEGANDSDQSDLGN